MPRLAKSEFCATKTVTEFNAMNTYQRQLLDKLITELAALDPSIRIAQMLAAELKGAMHAQIIGDDQSAPQIDTPTLDADGWVENTGEKPKCVVLEVRMLDRATGEIIERPYCNHLWNIEQTLAITHYKPA
jgi:hypothetical protein